MRLSIWQQFSSNHSSSFTVVGEFPTEDDAQHAAAELTRLVKSIADYYATHPEAAEVWIEQGLAPPTPPEIQMAEQYQVSIDNEHGLDWIWDGMPIEDAVVHLDKLVFVTHPGDTWYGAHPFDYILQKLGGIAMINGMQDTGPDHIELPSSTWIEQLSCTAPNEDTATNIADEIVTHLQVSQAAWQSAGKIEIPNAPWQPVNIPWFRRDASTYGGKVERQGRQLFFNQWYFRKIAYGLPAFVAYLKRNGCTDIHYEFASALEEDD